MSFLSDRDADTLCAIRAALERELDAAGPEALACLNRRLATAGADWSYYPGDALARRIHHAIAARILPETSALSGSEHVAAVAGGPVVIFANHLSYSDANLLEVLLHRHGRASLADRLTVVAGPKVYSSTRRRFSSLCFGTIKTPQSSARSSEDAVMSAREVARAARLCIAIALGRLRLGDALLVFAEGSRSRTGAMQQTLAAVSRYLDGPRSWVLPIGITGSERMFPVGEDRLHPVPVAARVGPPIDADALRAAAGGDRRLMMDVVGLAIARLLPPPYRGFYADAAPGLEQPRAVLAGLGGPAAV